MDRSMPIDRLYRPVNQTSGGPFSLLFSPARAGPRSQSFRNEITSRAPGDGTRATCIDRPRELRIPRACSRTEWICRSVCKARVQLACNRVRVAGGLSADPSHDSRSRRSRARRLSSTSPRATAAARTALARRAPVADCAERTWRRITPHPSSASDACTGTSTHSPLSRDGRGSRSHPDVPQSHSPPWRRDRNGWRRRCSRGMTGASVGWNTGLR